MAGQKAKGSKKNRKFGREKRKQANRGTAISLFVRNKISASEYFAKAGISSKKG